MPFLDFHTHKTYSNFDDTLVVKNMSQNDFTIFSPQPSSESLRYSVGLHPWYLTADNAARDLIQLEKFLTEQPTNIVAIGECGLDKLRGENLDFQAKIFQKQVELAEKYHLPVVIHCVRAFDLLLQLHKKWRSKVPMIVHGFNQNEKILTALLQKDFYISVGAAVLQEGTNAQNLLSKIPIQRLFLETDNANDHISIDKIYEFVAINKSVNFAELKQRITINYEGIMNYEFTQKIIHNS